MIFLKNIGIQLLPPIVYKGYKQLQRSLKKEDKENLVPKWSKILGGPAKDLFIFVKPNKYAFGEMIEGNYDDFFWDFLKNIDLEGKTIIDIGGHIGYHTICFSALTGKGGQVYVFEPNRFNTDRMELIFNKNEENTKNIRIEKYALSNIKGETVFNFSKNVDDQTSSGGYLDDSHTPLSEAAYKRANFSSESVKVDTLDNFSEKNKLDGLSLVKIDVEGAEHMVLEGGVETIKRHRPIMLIEVHSALAMINVCKVIYSLNYTISILKDEGGIGRCFISAVPNAQST